MSSAPLRMATHSSEVLVMKQCSGKLKIIVLLKNLRMKNVNATLVFILSTVLPTEFPLTPTELSAEEDHTAICLHSGHMRLRSSSARISLHS